MVLPSSVTYSPSATAARWPSSPSVNTLSPALRSSSPSQFRTPLSVATLPYCARMAARAALILSSLLIVRFLIIFENLPLLSAAIASAFSWLVSGSTEKYPSSEKPRKVPPLIASHTSSLLMWNSAKREPSLMSAKPSGAMPAAASLMNHCTISTPSTKAFGSCIMFTSLLLPSARYFCAI